MYSIEQQDLWEAYQQVCESSMILEDEMEGNPYPRNSDGTQMTWEQRRKYYENKKRKKGKVQEEVEISSQCFYEMGLNEDGIEILIEELGLAKFVEYVYDLAEEYYLTEDAVSDAPPKPKRTRTRKKTTPATQTARKTAVNTAVKSQPKKRPVLDAIARAVTSGIERHNTAMRLAGETGKAAGKVLGGAGRVLGGAASGALGTAGMLHHAATRGLEPTPEPASEKPKPKPRTRRKATTTTEEVEAWVNALVEEGYDLSEYTWEDMTEMYISEARITRSMGRRATQFRRDQEQEAHMERVRQHQERMKKDPAYAAEHERLRNIHRRPENKNESYDLFDTILEYLVAEGYADTNENALVIMANMSEEWRQSIVEFTPNLSVAYNVLQPRPTAPGTLDAARTSGLLGAPKPVSGSAPKPPKPVSGSAPKPPKPVSGSAPKPPKPVSRIV